MSKKNTKNHISDVVIIGAGPAGMTAAITCAREGLRVTLLEKNPQIGKKILSTGNGKCNLTNFSQKPEDYRSEKPAFAWEAYQCFKVVETLAFLDSLGLYTKNKNDYVYPYNEQAAAVREAFETAVSTHPLIQVMTECTVTGIGYKNGNYTVFSERGTYKAKSILISVGGKAAPKLGSTGDGYAWAKSFGHTIVKPLPALMALKSGAPFLKKVSGVRNQAGIRLFVDKQCIAEERGELQWTDYGISGVAIFQLSRYAAVALEEKKQVALELDLCPTLSEEDLKDLLLKFKKNCPYKTVRELLFGILPAKLCPVILREARVEEEVLSEDLSNQMMEKIVEAVKHFLLRVNGTMDFEKSQTTRGGVCLDEITPDMESKYCPGLFFAGEVLDVDGTCGGYNLQWAFTSGTLAAREIVKRKEQR